MATLKSNKQREPFSPDPFYTVHYAGHVPDLKVHQSAHSTTNLSNIMMFVVVWLVVTCVSCCDWMLCLFRIDIIVGHVNATERTIAH